MSGPDEKDQNPQLKRAVEGAKSLKDQANGRTDVTQRTSNESDTSPANGPTQAPGRNDVKAFDFDAGAILGGMPADDLVMRSMLAGGWGKYIGVPLVRQAIRQAQTYVTLMSMLGPDRVSRDGPTPIADIINAGGIAGAFDRGSLQNLYDMFLTQSRAETPTLLAQARQGANIPGAKPMTDAERVAQAKRDFMATGEMISPIRYALQSSPGILRNLIGLRSYGNSTYGALADDYFEKVAAPYYGAHLPEILPQYSDILNWWDALSAPNRKR